MARQSGSADDFIGCIVVIVIGVMVFGFIASVFDDSADELAPKPPKPELKDARVYVTGDDGGAFRISYAIWDPEALGEATRQKKVSGVIGSEPQYLPLEVSGFRSDRNNQPIGDDEDIQVRVRKAGHWQGEVVGILEVNEKVVDCTRHNQGLSNGIMSFDADDPQEYERDNICRLYMWVF